MWPSSLACSSLCSGPSTKDIHTGSMSVDVFKLPCLSSWWHQCHQCASFTKEFLYTGILNILSFVFQLLVQVKKRIHKVSHVYFLPFKTFYCEGTCLLFMLCVVLPKKLRNASVWMRSWKFYEMCSVMCASSLMEVYAIEDYQMSTCLWMSLMSDNEANLFY